MNDYILYPSNTYAGSCNNYMLRSNEERLVTSRMCFRVEEGGTFPYRFFFNNAVDGTYDNGSVSRANLFGDPYEVVSAYAGTLHTLLDAVKQLPLKAVTFGGKASRSVAAGEEYMSDELTLDVGKDEYLVFEWTVKGKNIPYTPDKMFTCFTRFGDDWRAGRECPQPTAIGCRRPIKGEMAFWGDSITQGLGTCDNKYEFWVAEIGKRLPGVAVRNLGLGFGRASDAASRGVWFGKAAQYPFVSLCFGVNDIMQGCDADGIKESISQAVTGLRERGVKVGIFTIPPFDYNGGQEKIWRECCAYIKEEIAPMCEYCFDTAPVWGMKPPYDHLSRWFSHPATPGGEILADVFVKTYGYNNILKMINGGRDEFRT